MGAFQHWAEIAQLLMLGEPHHLAESILELWWALEPLTTFFDLEVLDDAPSSRLADPIPYECSLSLAHQAHPRGSYSVACDRGQPGSHVSFTTQMTVLATLPGEAIPHQTAPTSQPSEHMPGFAESVKEPPWAMMSPTPSPKAEEITALVPLPKTEEDVALAPSGWMQLHSSRSVDPLGLVLPDLGTEWCCCHNCSHSSHKRAQAWAEKYQQEDGDPNDSIAIATREPSPSQRLPGLSMGMGCQRWSKVFPQRRLDIRTPSWWWGPPCCLPT